MIKLSLFSLFSFLLCLATTPVLGMAIDTPLIIAAKVKIEGKITRPSSTSTDSVFVNIVAAYPISGAFVKYKTVVDRSGKFSTDVEVETSTSFIRLTTSLNPDQPLMVKLKNGEVTHLDLTYNSSFDIENIEVKPSMNQNDTRQYFDLILQLLQYRSDKAKEPLYNKSTDYFLDYAKIILAERLSIVKSDTLLSNEVKQLLVKDYQLVFYKDAVFDYERAMRSNYLNTDGDKDKKPDVKNIDRTYYRFLKDLGLNDPQYLKVFTFLEFQSKILRNEILAIPRIEDNDIPSWLTKVKVILSDQIGFSNGQYYDILVANAYSQQLNEELRPLSAKQKKNIESYWKNGEIAKILFRKNQKVVELAQYQSPVVINDVSTVATEKVIETILAKYKDKVVLIDLWATWCVPCLQAMQEFRGTKKEFLGKDVTFVYLSNASSPKALWEEKIKGIGSEHYYLNDAQWMFIMEKFKFEYIPSYLLFDKKGQLIKKYTAFPGNKELKEKINGSL